jgi:cation diffusion facilitator CzcD-associated flavoprotein CzcO
MDAVTGNRDVTRPRGVDAAANGHASGNGRPPAEVEVVVIGSGFSGLAIAAELKRSGRHDFVVLERASDLGGTWRDNNYPGCACDVPSHLYSFAFAPNPNWSSTFSPQGEIWDYMRRVAEDEGLLSHIHFDCELEGGEWNDEAQRWRLRTAAGALTARVLVVAAGPLSEPSLPDIPGLSDFRGPVFHSATWDHDHDLTGERVAVVGTGASAIQFVPQIQPTVSRLHVFQRTPPWIMPRRARKLTRFERALYRRLPAAQLLMRAAIYWGRELYAVPLLRVALARATRAAGLSYLRRHVPDPELRAKLTPGYAPGCKRILISNDYLPALAKPNVEVVCDGIAEVREHSVITRDGAEREVDTIIFGTGFHVTDMPIANRLRGRDGRTMAASWDAGPQAHRGTTVAGFPNLFLLLGPNTGSGHTSVVLVAEAQAKHAVQALEHMRARRTATFEVRPEVQEAWNAEVQRRMRGTVWTAGGCASWYLDKSGRNSTLWPDFSFRLLSELRRFDPAEYRFSPAKAPIPSAGVLELTA